MTACSFTGPLSKDAEARTTRNGEHLLHVILEVPAGYRGAVVKVKATKLYGSGPSAALACKSRAHHLRRGVRVTVSGQRLSWYRGAAELDGLDRLDAPDLTYTDRIGGND
jgi:hypothetical protein